MTAPDNGIQTDADPDATGGAPGSVEGGSFVGVAAVPPQWEESPPPPAPAPEPRPPRQRTGKHDSEPPEDEMAAIDSLAGSPSPIISQYLYPTERFRGEWRRHPAHLVGPAMTTVAATAGLGVLLVLKGAIDPYLTPYVSPWLVTAIMIVLWLVMLGRAGWQVALWHYDRFVLTDKRIMVVNGIITRKVAMMPLGRVTDMKYEQSILGRLLNYGTFVLESAGQDQALREVQHLPRPNDLYLRVVEEMYAS